MDGYSISDLTEHYEYESHKAVTHRLDSAVEKIVKRNNETWLMAARKRLKKGGEN